eukprot:CAMPEP_0172723696 /NCGR_PEP_ID=MMETSP1074-20121228/84263_1 /TAXON_ID=2916 /ORGANISM="Ceratium fusus, Strain PA161109" /LENGTH=130 /DNA_ID=CAMNT_0013549985 /DNA_START=86 /DNA_END=479 /DNA_ORIENTATION=-
MTMPELSIERDCGVDTGFRTETLPMKGKVTEQEDRVYSRATLSTTVSSSCSLSVASDAELSSAGLPDDGSQEDLLEATQSEKVTESGDGAQVSDASQSLMTSESLKFWTKIRAPFEVSTAAPVRATWGCH